MDDRWAGLSELSNRLGLPTQSAVRPKVGIPMYESSIRSSESYYECNECDWSGIRVIKSRKHSRRTGHSVEEMEWRPEQTNMPWTEVRVVPEEEEE